MKQHERAYSVDRKILLPACICILTLLSVFVCTRKEGFYIDELWSYGLANSYELPYLQDKEGYLATWHEPSFYMDYLRVTDGNEAFAYASVVSNQAVDVHPPLYYLLLHTICSFLPGSWTKWTGLALNMVFDACILFLVFQIMLLLCRGDETADVTGSDGASGNRFFDRGTWFPLAVMTGYGLSAAAFTQVLYIRMYQMLTCFVLLALYLTLRMLRRTEHTSGKAALRLCIAMFFAVLAGFLTHYYFLIFLFFLTATAIVILLFRKQFVTAGYWLLSHALAGGLGLLLFPAALTQIFQGDKGQESFSALSEGGRRMIAKVFSFGDLAAGELFGIPNGVALLIAALLLAAAAFVCVSAGTEDTSGTAGRLMRGLRAEPAVVILPTLCFFVTVSVVATDYADRYLFAVYPCICICFGILIFEIGRRYKTAALVLTGLMLVLQVSSSLFGNRIAYLYPGYAAAENTLAEQYADVPGVYVTKGDHLVINNILFLSALDRTIAVEETRKEEIPQMLADAGFADTDALVLFVDIYFDEEETAKRIASETGLTGIEKIYDNTFTQIYLLRKTS